MFVVVRVAQAVVSSGVCVAGRGTPNLTDDELRPGAQPKRLRRREPGARHMGSRHPERASARGHDHRGYRRARAADERRHTLTARRVCEIRDAAERCFCKRVLYLRGRDPNSEKLRKI